jgi:hypothetical protein
MGDAASFRGKIDISSSNDILILGNSFGMNVDWHERRRWCGVHLHDQHDGATTEC